MLNKTLYTSYRLHKKIVLFVALLSLIMNQSCSKMETDAGVPNQNGEYVKRFFQRPTECKPELDSLIAFLKKDNDKTDFVNKLPANAGYPVWESTIREKSTSSGILARGIFIDENKNYIIPLTNDGKSLSALLIVQFYNDQFIYNCYTNDYLYTLCHSETIADKSVKEKALNLFIFMSNYVYDDVKFKQIPKELFGLNNIVQDGPLTKMLTIKPVELNTADTTAGGMKMVIVCVTSSHCTGLASGDCTMYHCDQCPDCENTNCTVLSSGGGGNGSNGNGTGGNNSNIGNGGYGGYGGNNGSGSGGAAPDPPFPVIVPYTPPLPPCPGIAWYRMPRDGEEPAPCDPSAPVTPNFYGLNIVGDFNELKDYEEWKNNSIDTTGLNAHPCLKDIYVAMTTSPTFYNMLKNFTEVNPTGNVKFQMNSDPNVAYAAETNAAIPGQLSTITFYTDPLSHSTKSFSTITFIHEMIHADFYRILMRMGSDTSIRNTYPKVIKALGHFRHPEILDHEFMANEYIPFLTSVFTEVDFLLGSGPHLNPNNSINTEYYTAMAWSGLQETAAWALLPQDIRTKYELILSREAYLGTGCN